MPIEFETHFHPAQQLYKEAVDRGLGRAPGAPAADRQPAPVCAVVAAKALTGWAGYTIEYLIRADQEQREVGEIIDDSGAIMARYGQGFATRGLETERKAASFLRDPRLIVHQDEVEMLETHKIIGVWISVIYPDGEEHGLAVLSRDELPPQLRERCEANDQMITVDTMVGFTNFPAMAMTEDLAHWICSGDTRKVLTP